MRGGQGDRPGGRSPDGLGRSPAWSGGRSPSQLLVAIAIVLGIVLGGASVVSLLTASPRVPQPAPSDSATGPAKVPGAAPVAVTAVVPYWSAGTGMASARRHQDLLTRVSPWLLGLDARGQVISLPEHDDVPVELSAALDVDDVLDASAPACLVGRLRRSGLGVPVQPTVANYDTRRWQVAPVQAILRDRARREAHVAELVALVEQHGWDGLTIDYEDLTGRDRQRFSRFITRLGQELHARDKRLAVDVFAKPHDRGYDERNLAQDYAAIGRAADEVRIMAYDYHWETSAPGPIAPVGWVREVLEYAVSVIPREKITLGLPMYGYEWPGEPGGSATASATAASPVSWRQAFDRARAAGVQPTWDEQSASPWFTYHPGKPRKPGQPGKAGSGASHTVWFENACSLHAKLAVARAYQIGGVFLWLYGPEDPGVWDELRAPGSSACMRGAATQAGQQVSGEGEQR